uniref:Uncharacterized protein n=1 Tax=Oryza punctata TaxID=4537 RepID=A0A0E0JV27_ORYPU
MTTVTGGQGRQWASGRPLPPLLPPPTGSAAPTLRKPPSRHLGPLLPSSVCRRHRCSLPPRSTAAPHPILVEKEEQRHRPLSFSFRSRRSSVAAFVHSLPLPNVVEQPPPLLLFVEPPSSLPCCRRATAIERRAAGGSSSEPVSIAHSICKEGRGYNHDPQLLGSSMTNVVPTGSFGCLVTGGSMSQGQYGIPVTVMCAFG